MTEAVLTVAPSWQMWAVFALILVALIGYANHKVPMEVVSFATICALMVLFAMAPLETDPGRLSPERILQGFANPALLTVLALLVMGEGIARTGLLERSAQTAMRMGGDRVGFAMVVSLVAVVVVSAFMNNIPVVVIFIPIMRELARQFGMHVGRVMIPLGYAAVLGGMTTLIGSSTNLLVNGALHEVGVEPFGFFDFTLIGSVLALVGLVFVILVAPRLLPERAGFAASIFEPGSLQFLVQLVVSEKSKLVGETAPTGIFKSLQGLTVRLVQRGESAVLPPFDDIALAPGDIIVVAAPRKALMDLLAKDKGLLFPGLHEAEEGETAAEEEAEDEGKPIKGSQQILAEAMVTPASNLIGQTLTRIRFHRRTGCIVLGIQRKARMFPSQLSEITLEPGDVLLIQGRPDDIEALRANRDVLLIEWSRQELPSAHHVRHAATIFIGALAAAATGLLPMVTATIIGAVAMVASGVLNVRQATRAINLNIVGTMAVALALGLALYETGGAAYIANAFVATMAGAPPWAVLSAFFLLLAGLSNIVSTKTTAVLFTPVAIDIALQIGVDPHAFAVAVVFAANCSFASPIGYQTNLLVMGPGHYRFTDFARAGIPLILILWLVFTAFAPWYYGI